MGGRITYSIGDLFQATKIEWTKLQGSVVWCFNEIFSSYWNYTTTILIPNVLKNKYFFISIQKVLLLLKLQFWNLIRFYCYSQVQLRICLVENLVKIANLENLIFVRILLPQRRFQEECQFSARYFHFESMILLVLHQQI